MLPPLENKVMELLFGAAVIHSLYLVLLLVLKSKKGKSLIWLSLLMLPVACWLINYFLYVSELIKDFPHLLGIFSPIIFLMGPFFYFFIKHSYRGSFKLKWFHVFHLAPALYYGVNAIKLFRLSLHEKLQFIEIPFSGIKPSFPELLWGNLLIFITIAYVITAYNDLRTLKLNTENNPKLTQWLQRFTLAFGTLLCFKIILESLFWFMDWSGVLVELFSILLIATAIHVLGYILLGKEQILPTSLRPSQIKYATSSLSDTQLKSYAKDILNYLDTKQAWLDPKFSITDLSKAISLPKHHISQTLTEEMESSFHDLINLKRVEEAKRRLNSEDIKRFSMVGIASSCGFGSKSSFNRAFKKQTGTTPSAYLLALKNGAKTTS